MKKLLLVLFAAIALAGCTKEYNTYTEMNRIIRDFVITDDPFPNGWGFESGNAPHYYFNFDFPELDKFLYDNGTIVVYYDNGRTQYPLPYIRDLEAASGSGETRTWMRTLDYEYQRGKISFYVTNNDFQYLSTETDDIMLNGKPRELKFRVVIIW